MFFLYIIVWKLIKFYALLLFSILRNAYLYNTFINATVEYEN